MYRSSFVRLVCALDVLLFAPGSIAGIFILLEKDGPADIDRCALCLEFGQLAINPVFGLA
jgi:hypothetical protein